MFFHYSLTRLIPYRLNTYLNQLQTFGILKKSIKIFHWHCKNTTLTNPFDYQNEISTVDFKIKIIYTDQTNLFKQAPTGSTEIFPVSNYLKINIKHKIRVYRKDSQICIITNRQPTETLLIKLVATIPILIPNSLDEEHYMFFKDIPDMPWTNFTELSQHPTFIEATKLMSNFSKNADLIKEKLITFYSKNKETEINDITTRINQQNQRIENFMQNIQMAYNNIHALQKELFFLKNGPVTIDTVGLDTFCKILDNTPEIKYYNLENEHTLNIVIITPIKWFDEIAAKRLSTTHQSSIIKNFFKKVLCEQEYTINFYSSLNYNLKTGHVTNRFDNDLLERIKVIYPNIIPNPHIMGYNCWGSNLSAILNATQKHEYHVALTQIIAATANLNVYDSAVINKLGEYLRNTSCKPLLKDGEYYSVQEILESNTD